MTDDIHLNKAAIIDRCLERIRDEYQDDPDRLENFTIQDSIVLNLQRACEAAIDLAMHLVALRKLGVPQNSRDAFKLLGEKGLIGEETMRAMQSMVGFRNLAVHNYQQMQLSILRSILERRLDDFTRFVEELRSSTR